MEWPIRKIYQLAKLHVAIIDGLRPLNVTSLQDINHVIDAEGQSLMQGFYDMLVSSKDHQITDGITLAAQLVHLIHNIGRLTTKVVLVQ